MSHIEGVDNGVGYGVRGRSTNGQGVIGRSTNGQGVLGESDNMIGVVGSSPHGTGVYGEGEYFGMYSSTQKGTAVYALSPEGIA